MATGNTFVDAASKGLDMVSKTHANQAMEDLQNSVIRQAKSMGIDPGTDEFEDLVMRKIVEPEQRTLKHLRGPKSVVRADMFLSEVDSKYVHSLFIDRLRHWCKVNKGMHLSNASRILQMCPMQIKHLGEMSKVQGHEDFSGWLDGSDDTTYSGVHPDDIHGGVHGLQVLM